MAYKHSINAMKKITFMMLLAAFFTLCVTSCSKDDDDSFAYPMEQLYGKWKAVEIKVDGKWYDVTKYPYTRFGMDITFYEGGKFYGSGYLGNGSGTYTVSGKTKVVRSTLSIPSTLLMETRQTLRYEWAVRLYR